MHHEEHDVPLAATGKRRIALLLFIGILPFELNGFYNGVLHQFPRWYWTVELVSWVALPLAIYLVGRRQGLFDRHAVGFDLRLRGRRRPWAWLGVVCAVSVALPIIEIASYHSATGWFPVNVGAVSFNYRDLLPPPGPARLLVTVYLAVSAALVEEFYYRGLFSRLFSNTRLQSILYVVISAVVFSSIHWEAGVRSLCSSLIFGVVAAATFRLTGNVWPLVGAHLLDDLYWFS